MAAQTELEVVIRAVNETKETVRQVGEDFKKTFNEVAKANKDVTDSFGAMKEGMKSITEGIHALKTLGGFTILYESVKSLAEIPIALADIAAKTNDLAQGLKVVGVNAGFSVAGINAAREAIEKLGFSSEETVKSLSKLLVEGISPDQAAKLAEVAKRIAVVTAHAQDEVLQDVTYAVSRGTTRLLQVKYGLALDAQLEFIKRQHELGRTLYEDERRPTIAQSLIDKGGSQFGGALDPDRVKTTTELQDDLNTSLSHTKEIIGNELLPNYRAMLATLREITDWLNHTGTTSALGAALAFTAKYPATPYGAFRLGADAINKYKEGRAAREKAPGEYIGDLPLDTEEAQTERARKAEERRIQDQKNLRSAIKAQQDVIVEGAKTQESIAKANNEKLEALDKERFDRGLITIEDYYKGVDARTADNYAFQRKTAIATLNAAKADFESVKNVTGYDPAKAGNTPAPAEYSQAQAAVAKAQLSLSTIEAQNALNNAKNTVAYRGEVLKTTRAIEDEVDAQREAADSQDLKAALDAITHKYERLRESVHDVTGELAKYEEEFYKNQKVFDVNNKIIQNTIDLNQALIDVKRAGNQVLVSRGEITTIEAQNRNNQLIADEISLRRAALDATNAQIASGTLSAENQRQAQLKVIQYQKDILVLQGQIQTVGLQLQQQFTNSLASAIQHLIDRSKTLKDTLLDLARAARDSVASAFAKDLAEKGVQLIIENTGGAGNSVFDSLGKLLGDRGTEANPMVVTLSSRDRALQASSDSTGSIAGLFGGVNDSGPTGGTFADALAEGAIAMADGGPINGPSHAGGGVNLNAEGGEFIVRKSQTAKWAGLLHAINSGYIDSVAPSRKRSFATGGMVDHGGGGGNNNISITINDGLASANGDSGRATAFAKHMTGIVQAELIRQKRSGGMLAPQPAG